MIPFLNSCKIQLFGLPVYMSIIILKYDFYQVWGAYLNRVLFLYPFSFPVSYFYMIQISYFLQTKLPNPYIEIYDFNQELICS